MGWTRSGPLCCSVILAAVAVCVLAAPAGAAPQTHTVEAPAGWTIGALPGLGLHDKLRAGGTLLPWLEPYAALTPWVSSTAGGDGRPQTSGGLLLDIPVGGGFTFTPSIGAGYTPGRLRPEGEGEAMAFRSQLEIGYAFDNNARVTLGYTRMRRAGDGREGGETLGFTLRLPFGALTGD